MSMSISPAKHLCKRDITSFYAWMLLKLRACSIEVELCEKLF